MGVAIISDIHREFELTIWQESLNFGIAKGNSITTAHTLQQPSREQTERKGELNNAVMGRLIK